MARATKPVRRITTFLFGLLAAAFSLASPAQERRLPVVGHLYYTTAALAKHADDEFREALRELGYVDGRNVSLVTLYAEGNDERIPVLVNRMVAARVDVMVVNSKASHVAIEATKSIPIVSIFTDPVRAGLVRSLARPGSNFTGVSVNRQTITELAAGRVPIVSETREWAEAGALFTYVATAFDWNRTAARYVARILAGAKPGDLPIEQASKFEFVINLRAARQFNIAIPASMLLRADEVIR